MGEPGADGRFGTFGGRFVPEALIPACQDLERDFRAAWSSHSFKDRYDDILRDYAGRPSALTECHNLSHELGVRVLLKREDLNHTGSHKINNVIGQGLLTLEMGKQRLVAETGAGQHGVATATAAALFGLECVVYMGEVDMERQELNVFRMRLLGAEVRPVHSGSRTVERRRQRSAPGLGGKCRIDALLPRLCNGAPSVPLDGARVPGGNRYRGTPAMPKLVRRGPRFRRCLCGRRQQRRRHLLRLRGHAGPAGRCRSRRWRRHGPTGIPGVLHGMRSYLLQDEFGQIVEAESISAGLDYPGIGPEHAYLAEVGRARYVSATDAEVLDALQLLARTEGIIPALEPAHALAWLFKAAKNEEVPGGSSVLLTMSGRGDKDAEHVMKLLGAAP